VFQARVDFGGGAGEQQHHAGQEHQDRQNRCGQPGSGADGLLGEQQARASLASSSTQASSSGSTT
jgi:hypothetical protein